MKIKGIILTAAICAGSVVGISYGVSRVMSSNVKPVEVVEVDSVNTAGYNFFNSDTISGTVVSRDTQSVELDDDHKLVAVYVSAGDSVKKGDVIEIRFGEKTVRVEVTEIIETTKKENAADMYRYL